MSEQINFLNKLIRRIIIVHLIKNSCERGKGCEAGRRLWGNGGKCAADRAGRLAAR